MSHDQNWEQIRKDFLGLGLQVGTKSFYPQLIERLEQIKMSEESLQEILDCLYDALIIHDLDGNLVRFNKPFLSLYQLSPEEAKAHTIYSLSSPSSSKELGKEYHQRAIHGDQHVLFEWKAIRPDDQSEFDVEVALRKIQWLGKDMIVALIRDISARKNAEEDRERLMREIQRHKGELERMLYVFGHDMRAPLVNIHGFSSELQSQLDELISKMHLNNDYDISSLIHVEIPNSLKFITSSVKKLSLMINGMLQIGRLGQARLDVQFIDTNIIINTLLESMEWQIKEAHAEVHTSFLPPCCGDPQWVSQIFGNLIDNALKYRSPDRPLQIQIDGKLQKKFCIFTIRDNGKGIQKDHLQKIWDLFYRATNKEGPQGEGIGLTMVRQIVERHGGQITCDSEEGKGSTFTLILPAPSQGG